MAGREPARFQALPRASEIYAQATDAWTLAAVEQKLGVHTRGSTDLEEQWLSATRIRPLRDVDDEDLARLLTRGLHVPLLLPMGLSRLRAAVKSRTPPDGDLVRACGAAAWLIKRRLPEKADEAMAVLRALLQTEWLDGRVDVMEAAYSALEAMPLK